MSNGNGVRIHEGLPYPLGATWDGARRQFRAVLRARDQGRAVPVRRRPAHARSSASSCPSTPTRSGTAICPMRGPGTVYGYRVHGPYEPRGGPPLQSQQAAARPLRQGASSASSTGARRCSATRIGDADDDLTFDERDSAPFMPKCRVIDPAFTWGRDRRAARAVGPHHHLRDARRGFTKLHPARARGAARHLRRPRPPRRASTTSAPRRHRGRAAAGPRLRRRPATCSSKG